MEAIADVAGITRRTVYNNFSDKAEVYQRVFYPLVAQLGIRARWRPSASLEPVHRLDVHADAVISLIYDSDHQGLLGVAVRDGESQPWLGEHYRRRVQLPMRSSFQETLREAGYAGYLAVGSEEDACRQFFALVEGMITLPRLLSLRCPTHALDKGRIKAAAVAMMKSYTSAIE